MKFLFAIFLLFSINVNANENELQEEARKFIENIGNKIIAVAKEKKYSESLKRQKIIDIVDSSIDPSWISRFVLGKNFKNFNNQQKTKFTKLYRDFMIYTYGPKFKDYNGRKFQVNEISFKNNTYLVKSEFLPKDSDIPILVDFKVKKNEEGFLILDFIAEGISLIETQRSEFNSVISEKGIDKFLEDLEVKINKLKKS